MLKSWYTCTAIVALLALLTWSCVSSNTNQPTTSASPQVTTTPTPASTTTFDFGAYTGNKQFKLNTLQTTPYGPAWADITLQKSNFLECKGASIALCYYSGPGPTTPCNINGGNLA